MDPRPYTLRELLDMHEGRARNEWMHTATVCALLANIHRDPRKRKRPFAPADFDPFAIADRKTQAPVTQEEWSALRAMLEMQASKKEIKHGTDTRDTVDSAQ